MDVQLDPMRAFVPPGVLPVPTPVADVPPAAAAEPALAGDQTLPTAGTTALQQSAAADYGALPWGDAAATLDEEAQGLLTELGQGDRYLGVAQLILESLQGGQIDPAMAKAMMRQVLAPDTHVQQLGQMACVGATVQKVFAASNPAGYVRAALDLLAAGSTTLPSGVELAASELNQTEVKAWPDPMARLNGIMQAALMDRANGVDAYDLLADISTRDDGSTYRGLNEQQAAAITGALIGVPMLDAVAMDGVPLAEGLAQQLEAAKAAGAIGLLVPIRGDTGLRHLVLLSDLQADVDLASFMDARGQAGTLTYEAFLGAVSLERQGALQMDTIGGSTNRAASGPSTAARQPVRPPAPPASPAPAGSGAVGG